MESPLVYPQLSGVPAEGREDVALLLGLANEPGHQLCRRLCVDFSLAEHLHAYDSSRPDPIVATAAAQLLPPLAAQAERVRRAPHTLSASTPGPTLPINLAPTAPYQSLLDYYSVSEEVQVPAPLAALQASVGAPSSGCSQDPQTFCRGRLAGQLYADTGNACRTFYICAQPFADSAYVAILPVHLTQGGNLLDPQ